MVLEKKFLFFISLIIFHLFSKITTFQIRNLLNKEDIGRVCKNIDKDYKKPITSMPLNDYIDSLSINNNEYNLNSEKEKILTNLLVFGKSNDISNFYSNSFYKIIIFSFLLFCFLTWIILITCSFKKICFFNKRSNYIKYGFYSPLISIIAFIILIIIAIFSFLKLEKFFKYFNGSTCSLLHFFYNIRLGINKKYTFNENYEKIWPGLLNIESYLIDTSSAINEIADIKNSSFINHDIILKKSFEYEKLLNEFNNTSFYLSNPNYSIKNKIYPLYLKLFSDSSEKTINSKRFYYEYKNNINETIKILNELYNYFNEITNKKEIYIYDINDTLIHMNNFTILMNNMSTIVSQNFLNLHDDSEIILLYILDIIHYTFILLSLLIILILSVYIHKKNQGLKIILHLFWNILLLLVIISGLIGVLLIVISQLCKDLIPIFNQIFSEKYLNSDKSLFPKVTNAASYLDICLNQDGDLSKILNLKDTSINELNEYLGKFTTKQSKLKQLDSFENYNITLKQINQYLIDFSKTTDNSYGKSNIIYLLQQITELTNNNNIEKCQTNDYWVSIKENCPKDYIYITKKNITSKKKNLKYCLSIIDDYSEKDITNLYSKVCKNQYLHEINDYIKGLSIYYKENEKLIKKISNDLIKLNVKYYELNNFINIEQKNANNLINLFTKIYLPIVGRGTIFQLFNCKVIKKDIILFYDQFLNYFSKISKNIGIYIIICCIIAYFSIYFLIMSIVWNSKESKKYYKKNKNKDNENKIELLEYTNHSIQEDEKEDEESTLHNDKSNI